MQVQIPIFILGLLLHTGIFLTSDKPDRRLRTMAGLAILCITWPTWYAGVLMDASGETVWQWIGLVLENAPFFLPPLSFLAYWRRH